jgi:hypothetical protein
MGRPKKNRRKALEEKIKQGVKIFTKAGVTIHCSVCGKANHNKMGHDEYLETLAELRENIIIGKDDDIDIPLLFMYLYLTFMLWKSYNAVCSF